MTVSTNNEPQGHVPMKIAPFECEAASSSSREPALGQGHVDERAVHAGWTVRTFVPSVEWVLQVYASVFPEWKPLPD